MRRLTVVLATLPIVGVHLAASVAFAGCQVDTEPVAFGIVDLTRATNSTGLIVLNCSITTNIEVALSSDSAPGQRTMTGPNAGRLKYELYTDAGRQVEWGDGSGNGKRVPAIAVGEETRRLTVYGQVPRQDAVPAGAYTDSLTVVVSF